MEEQLDENPNGSNPTDNPRIDDLIEQRVSRRGVLAGALGVGATAFLGGRSVALDRSQAVTVAQGTRPRVPLIGFAEIPPSDADLVIVPPGYRAEVLVPWGTPLFRHSPEFREDASNSAADQELQVGFNHDGMHFFPLGRFSPGEQSRRGLLVVNHEYTDARQIYSAAQGAAITPDAAGREKVAKALAAHGLTVVEIRRGGDGRWAHVRGSEYNRRIAGETSMAFSGPVRADHPMLRSSVTPSPKGTLNNCASGATPWGTYVTCEENWNGYFGTDDPSWTPTALESRYGVSRSGFGYGWHRAEPRFDLARNRNELNHFGWCVEVDPFAPRSVPVKRTALGRFKHEGATFTESHGRIVVYSGDDENGDYVYKFVGDRPWRAHRARGESPLDHGRLYVARFAADGSGSWIPLEHGEGPLTLANGWLDQADVLIRTRQAADAVGATRLHRPEWVAVHPRTRDVFLALTNGSGHGAPVNSGRDPNPYGHVLRFRESRGDHTAFSFEWDVLVLAGDPGFDPRVPAAQPVFGSPDGLFVDEDGRLWIETDISNSVQLRGDYANIKNNMMLCADPATGEVRRFLTGPRGCEITGITMTPDGRTMFCNIQHPGESTRYWNDLHGAPSNDRPSTVSSWPFGGRPRSATVVITKLDGGRIGT